MTHGPLFFFPLRSIAKQTPTHQQPETALPDFGPQAYGANGAEAHDLDEANLAH